MAVSLSADNSRCLIIIIIIIITLILFYTY
jgi:hypothetical protein